MSMDSCSGRVSEVLWEEHLLFIFLKKSVSHEEVFRRGGVWKAQLCSMQVGAFPGDPPLPAHLGMGLSSSRNSAASSDPHLNPTFPKCCSSSVPVLCIFGRTFKMKWKLPESCCACWTWQKMLSWDCDLLEQRHCLWKGGSLCFWL